MIVIGSVIALPDRGDKKPINAGIVMKALKENEVYKIYNIDTQAYEALKITNPKYLNWKFRETLLPFIITGKISNLTSNTLALNFASSTLTNYLYSSLLILSFNIRHGLYTFDLCDENFNKVFIIDSSDVKIIFEYHKNYNFSIGDLIICKKSDKKQNIIFGRKYKILDMQCYGYYNTLYLENIDNPKERIFAKSIYFKKYNNDI
jgi:hypothetical protein